MKQEMELLFVQNRQDRDMIEMWDASGTILYSVFHNDALSEEIRDSLSKYEAVTVVVRLLEIHE